MGVRKERKKSCWDYSYGFSSEDVRFVYICMDVYNRFRSSNSGGGGGGGKTTLVGGL